MTTVNIRWFGAYDLDSLDGKQIIMNKGIYAIYRVYGGKETLIYIGKTKRNFLKRLKEHNKDWLWKVRGEIRIRFGVLEFPNGGKYSEQKLADVESLLISWHEPVENTQSTKYYYGRPNLEVINEGRRGLIDKKISTIKYT
ncbi:TPA: GIY-YIG nuclease family protein [Bacillus pseudomycoides]|nr:GIY-YIG nuclease family protein [Bacillus pseudomycoides]